MYCVPGHIPNSPKPKSVFFRAQQFGLFSYTKKNVRMTLFLYFLNSLFLFFTYFRGSFGIAFDDSFDLPSVLWRFAGRWNEKMRSKGPFVSQGSRKWLAWELGGFVLEDRPNFSIVRIVGSTLRVSLGATRNSDLGKHHFWGANC